MEVIKCTYLCRYNWNTYHKVMLKSGKCVSIFPKGKPGVFKKLTLIDVSIRQMSTRAWNKINSSYWKWEGRIIWKQFLSLSTFKWYDNIDAHIGTYDGRGWRHERRRVVGESGEGGRQHGVEGGSQHSTVGPSSIARRVRAAPYVTWQARERCVRSTYATLSLQT